MLNNNQSEVARIKAQLELEAVAAHYALYAPSLGASKHEFITRRMQRMGELHDELKEKIGEEKATVFVVKAMEGKIFSAERRNFAASESH